MTLPPYRPLTETDHKLALLTMALGAARLTLIAVTYHEPANSNGEELSWPAVTLAFLLFFSGFLWIVLDSWHHGREWWKLLLQSHGAGFGGVAQLLGLTGLVPVAIGVWAWVITVAVCVFKTDFMGNEDGYVGDREGALVEHSDDHRLQQTGYEYQGKAKDAAGPQPQ